MKKCKVILSVIVEGMLVVTIGIFIYENLAYSNAVESMLPILLQYDDTTISNPIFSSDYVDRFKTAKKRLYNKCWGKLKEPTKNNKKSRA